MSGTELLSWIAANYPEIVRIMLTGNASVETLIRKALEHKDLLAKLDELAEANQQQARERERFLNDLELLNRLVVRDKHLCHMCILGKVAEGNSRTRPLAAMPSVGCAPPSGAKAGQRCAPGETHGRASPRGARFQRAENSMARWKRAPRDVCLYRHGRSAK